MPSSEDRLTEQEQPGTSGLATTGGSCSGSASWAAVAVSSRVSSSAVGPETRATRSFFGRGNLGSLDPDL